MRQHIIRALSRPAHGELGDARLGCLVHQLHIFSLKRMLHLGPWILLPTSY